MNLIPRNRLFDFDSLFDAFWPPVMQSGEESENALFSPRVDVREKEKSYEISAELPGVRKEDIQVHLDNGILSIEAEHKQEDREEKDGRIIRQERRYGKLIRSFNVGQELSESDIKAEFKDGVLRLKIPRMEMPQSTARKILIQ